MPELLQKSTDSAIRTFALGNQEVDVIKASRTVPTPWVVDAAFDLVGVRIIGNVPWLLSGSEFDTTQSFLFFRARFNQRLVEWSGGPIAIPPAKELTVSAVVNVAGVAVSATAAACATPNYQPFPARAVSRNSLASGVPSNAYVPFGAARYRAYVENTAGLAIPGTLAGPVIQALPTASFTNAARESYLNDVPASFEPFHWAELPAGIALGRIPTTGVRAAALAVAQTNSGALALETTLEFQIEP